MIDWSGLKPKVKTEYMQYTIDTLNRYFGIVALTKLEIFQVRYDENDKIVESMMIYEYNQKGKLVIFDRLRKMIKNQTFVLLDSLLTISRNIVDSVKGRRFENQTMCVRTIGLLRWLGNTFR